MPPLSLQAIFLSPFFLHHSPFTAREIYLGCLLQAFGPADVHVYQTYDTISFKQQYIEQEVV